MIQSIIALHDAINQTKSDTEKAMYILATFETDLTEVLHMVKEYLGGGNIGDILFTGTDIISDYLCNIQNDLGEVKNKLLELEKQTNNTNETR